MDDDRLSRAVRGRVWQAQRQSNMASAFALAAALNCAATTAQAATLVSSAPRSIRSAPRIPLNLREAPTAANVADGNAIRFDPSLAGSTITLTTGELKINHAITLVGPGAGNLVIRRRCQSHFLCVVREQEPARIDLGTVAAQRHTANCGGAIAWKRCYFDLSDE
jgi:hypothetical protein